VRRRILIKKRLLTQRRLSMKRAPGVLMGVVEEDRYALQEPLEFQVPVGESSQRNYMSRHGRHGFSELLPGYLVTGS
jgi:hypothetical protein